jgi:hypothetical protein
MKRTVTPLDVPIASALGQIRTNKTRRAYANADMAYFEEKFALYS